MNKLFTKIAALFLGMTMAVGVGVAVGTGGKASEARADALAYTLTPASGSNNSYAGNCDIAIDGITWNLTGNSQTQPWRIGGKSLSGVNRTLYSKTAISNDITKIEVTHGAASSITVNSWTLVVSENADFSSPISTLTPAFAANNTATINRPDGKNWANCYFKFTYNVTVSGSSNKFVEFSEAKFYKSGDTPTPTPTKLDDPVISINASNVVSWSEVEDAEGYTYTILDSNEQVAETDTITETSLNLNELGLSDGDYSITVVAKGDGTNTSDSDPSNSEDFTISSGPTPTSGWVETAIGDLTGDDIFVIVGNNGNNYAMSNNNGTSSAPTAVSVTVSGNYLTSDVADTIKWTLSGNSTDGYTFYPNGDTEKWLYCTSTNNGVRVGTNANKTFTIDGGYLKHSGTSRYVGIYNSADWRCYTSSSTNIDGQSFSYFKYVDSSPKITATANVTSLGIAGEATVTVTKLNGATGNFTAVAQNNNVELSLPSISQDESTATYTVTGRHNGTCDVTFDLDGTEQQIAEVVVSFTVNKALVSIALSGDFPRQLEQGLPFSHEGMVVTATYDDGPTADVTSSATFSAVDMQQLGDQTVTVSYAENNVTKTADYTLKIVAPTHFTVTFDSNGGSEVASITNIESGTAITKPSDPTKTNYRFDVWCTDDELTIEYNFSTPVTSNFILYARWILDTTHAGTAEDPYSVADARLAIDETVGVTSVYATGIISNIVTAYKDGVVSFDFIDNANNDASLRAYKCTATAAQSEKIEVGAVVVVSGNLTKYNTIYEFAQGCNLESIVVKELTKIELSGTYQTTFDEGDTFNHTGVVVTATYDDTSTKDVSSEATFSTPNMTQIGQQTVTVTYGGKSASYTITINEREVNTIAVATNPTKTTYYVGDTMDISGLTITVNYKTGSPATISSGFTLSPAADYEFTSADLTAGSKTFTVTYKTKTTTFTVNVVVKPTTIDDTLTRETTGITDGGNYGTWSGKSVTSDAVYAGQSAGGSDSIQLRSNNSNSGIITTTSGGKIKKVTVVWNTEDTQEGRTLNVYGKDSAYSAATDLYSTSTQGTSLGTIVCGTSTELTITGDYEYVGVRSNSGAMYLTSITFTWDDGSTPTPPTPTEQTIVSGTFDYDDKASLYIDDFGTMVIEIPEGMSNLSAVSTDPSGDFEYDYETVEYDLQNNTVSFDFITGVTSKADVEITFLWYDENWTDYLELTATVQLINPTGLAEARDFAKDINACCGQGDDMAGMWELIEDDWAGLSEATKSFLINAHYDVTGTGAQTVVTKHDDTHIELAEAMSRYDFMVEHYGMTNFMNKTGLSTGGRVVINPFISMGENSNMVAIVVIVSVVSLTAIGGYFFLKKRREQN